MIDNIQAVRFVQGSGQFSQETIRRYADIAPHPGAHVIFKTLLYFQSDNTQITPVNISPGMMKNL